MKTANIVLLSAILVLMGVSFVAAATDTQSLTINATVSAQATLSLTTSAITFADSDPDTVPAIPSTPPTIGVTAKVKTGSASTATLTWTAADDLKSAMSAGRRREAGLWPAPWLRLPPCLSPPGPVLASGPVP
jgi:hypothetical protein